MDESVEKIWTRFIFLVSGNAVGTGSVEHYSREQGHINAPI